MNCLGEVIKAHIPRACIATKEMLCVFGTAFDKPDPTSFGYVWDNELLLPIVGQPFARRIHSSLRV